MYRPRTLIVAAALLALAPFLITDSLAGKGGKKPKPPPTESDPAIAYTVGLNNLGSDLWVMDADGSSQIRLLEGSPGLRHEQSSWSPDGDEILFRRESTSDGDGIYAVDKAGGALRRLASVNGVKGGNGGPVWSPVPCPDGNAWIAYVSSDGTGWPDVYVVRPDGTSATPLIQTPDEYERDVSWSPGADRIAVRTIRTESSKSRLVIYELSTVEGVLTATATLDLNVVGSPLKEMWWGEPEWARTGERIAVSGRDPATGDEEIWIVDLADPLDPIRLLNPGQDESHPSWSPDDGHLVFSGGGIWTAAADGTGLRRLQGGRKKGNGDQPSWRR